MKHSVSVVSKTPSLTFKGYMPQERKIFLSQTPLGDPNPTASCLYFHQCADPCWHSQIHCSSKHQRAGKGTPFWFFRTGGVKRYFRKTFLRCIGIFWFAAWGRRSQKLFLCFGSIVICSLSTLWFYLNDMLQEQKVCKEWTKNLRWEPDWFFLSISKWFEQQTSLHSSLLQSPWTWKLWEVI